MKRRRNTERTIAFLKDFFLSHQDSWFSTNYVYKQLWTQAKKDGWYPYGRIGRLLQSEFLAKGLIEVSKSGRQWRSMMSFSHRPNKNN